MFAISENGTGAAGEGLGWNQSWVWSWVGAVFIYRHLRLGDLGENECFGARYQNQSPGTCCSMKTNPGASGVGSAQRADLCPGNCDWLEAAAQARSREHICSWAAAGEARCSLAFWKKVLSLNSVPQKEVCFHF